MAEFERTRIREREAPQQNAYEEALKRSQDRALRNANGRIVCKEADCPQMLTRQGRLRYYLASTVQDTPLQDWIVFTHEIRTVSGKHRHQGGLIIYVIEGKGYSVVNGVRCDWEKGDLVLLPLHEKGVEHQHFNVDPDKPSVWMAFINEAIHQHVASEMTQTEVSPEYKKAQESGAA
ncbi:MAG TPA: cupin domain-containing protein [Stellaceae bacterium]|jgi:quercetin dioxygenase-like cupin family protein